MNFRQLVLAAVSSGVALIIPTFGRLRSARVPSQTGGASAFPNARRAAVRLIAGHVPGASGLLCVPFAVPVPVPVPGPAWRRRGRGEARDRTGSSGVPPSIRRQA